MSSRQATAAPALEVDTRGSHPLRVLAWPAEGQDGDRRPYEREIRSPRSPYFRKQRTIANNRNPLTASRNPTETIQATSQSLKPTARHSAGVIANAAIATQAANCHRGSSCCGRRIGQA